MATEIDPGLTGSVINALPIDRMIGAPLNAMIKAQVQASQQYADFLMNVCLEPAKEGEGKIARQVQFSYDETQVDSEGKYVGTVEKTMRVPLLAAIAHPNINIEEGSVDFEMEVTQSAESRSETSAETSLEASAGWGPFKVKVTGKASHKSEQTRKTDTRAKYSIHCAMKRSGPPEPLMRVIDFLTDAATKPVTIGDGAPKNLEKLPEPSDPSGPPAPAKG